MRTRRIALAVALIAAAAGALYAKKKENWIDQPFTKWSVKDVRTILGKSPWAETKAFRGVVTGEHGSFNPNATGTGGGTLGVDVPNFEFTAVFFTALPVREAYVRMFQIENHYDTLPAAKQQAFNRVPTIDALLHGDVSKEIIVNLTFHCNDPIAMRDLTQWFNTQTVDTLKQNAYLYANSTQLQLMKYESPSQAHGIARFIFPRQQNGEPVLSSPSGKLRFQLSYVPGPNQQVYIDFRPENMVYDGKLAY